MDGLKQPKADRHIRWKYDAYSPIFPHEVITRFYSHRHQGFVEVERPYGPTACFKVPLNLTPVERYFPRTRLVK